MTVSPKARMSDKKSNSSGELKLMNIRIAIILCFGMTSTATPDNQNLKRYFNLIISLFQTVPP